jgi:hypothetical protein
MVDRPHAPGTSTTQIDSSDEIWLSYDPFTGAATTGRLHPTGATTRLGTLQLDREWVHIVPTSRGNVVFANYSWLVATGRFGSDGSFIDLATYPHSFEYYQLVAVRDELLLAYATGTTVAGPVSRAVVTRVHHDGRLEIVSEPYLLDEWTHVVAAREGVVLFYNSRSGAAATGAVTPDGGFRDLGTSFRFDKGWDDIVAADDGRVMFYDREGGNTATGLVDDQGRYGDLYTFNFLPGKRLVQTTGGRVVIIDGTEAKVFRIDSQGIPSEGRYAVGLPTDRRLVFVG